MKLTGVYTTAGALLSAKILAGSCDLQLTRAVTGSGAAAEGSDTLEQPRQTLGLGAVTRNGTTVTVEATLLSAQAESGYTLTQVGLYALDEDGSEILYRVYTIDQGILISPDCSLTAVFYLSDTVLTTTATTVQVTSAGVMLRSDGEQMIRGLHFYNADGSETISCAAADLQTIVSQLPQIIDHDITINVTGTALSSNLVIRDLVGPGRLYIKAASTLTVAGYIHICRCKLGFLELINIRPNGKSLVDLGNVGGATAPGAALGVEDSEWVRITSCTVTADSTVKGVGFFCKNSRVIINSVSATKRRYTLACTDRSLVILRSIITGSFATSSTCAICADEGSMIVCSKPLSTTDLNNSAWTEMYNGSILFSGSNMYTASAWGTV